MCQSRQQKVSARSNIGWASFKVKQQTVHFNSDRHTMLTKHRIVFLGAEGVGKSSIMNQFINGGFTERHKHTLVDCYQHVVKLQSGSYRHIEILDTGSLNQFPVMRDLNIQLGQAFAVVYAVDDHDSFITAIEICYRIYEIKGTRDVRMVLVGNKMDVSGNRRLISTECALNQASKSLKCVFVETSAKLNLNVSCTFQQLLPAASCIKSVSKQTAIKQNHTARGHSKRL